MDVVSRPSSAARAADPGDCMVQGTIGSLFSGIGGLELGLERAGLGPVVWQVEIDPFCRAVLAKHWPNVTRYEDVTRPRNYPKVDIICGGFPCQDVSSAGACRGLGGEQSSLWWYYADVVRQVRPRIVVVENVNSGKGLWLPYVRHQLHLLGYATRALLLSAADVGAPHLRRRVFVVADAHGDRELARAIDGQKVRASKASADALRRSPLQQRRGRQAGAKEAHAIRRSSGGWRDPEPGMVRVVHGVPDRLDGLGARRRALGNAVVPACAEAIGCVIIEMLRTAESNSEAKENGR